jgi:hypothetical protein
LGYIISRRYSTKWLESKRLLRISSVATKALLPYYSDIMRDKRIRSRADDPSIEYNTFV